VLPETQPLRFTFAVGSIPMKFYKGDHDDVPTRCMVQSYMELRQMSLAFNTDRLDPSHLLRMTVETDYTGKTALLRAHCRPLNMSGRPAILLWFKVRTHR
jgi:hypothetical protein